MRHHAQNSGFIPAPLAGRRRSQGKTRERQSTRHSFEQGPIELNAGERTESPYGRLGIRYEMRIVYDAPAPARQRGEVVQQNAISGFPLECGDLMQTLTAQLRPSGRQQQRPGCIETLETIV